MRKLIISLLLLVIVGCQPAFGVVNTTDTVERFPANGSSTTFNFTFRLTDQTELQALVRADSTGVDTALELNVDYTLSATNNDFSSGGTLTTTDTLASGNTLILHREALRTQTVNLIQGQAMPAEATETTFDKQTLAIQDIDKDMVFTITVPKGDPTTALSLTVPSSIDRANRTFTWDANGNPAATDSSTGVTVSAYAETYLDDVSEAAFKVTTNLETGIDLQAWDTQLDDIAALAVTNSNFIVGDGTNWVAESGTTARASLGAQASDAGLTSISGLTTAADKMIYTTASDTYAVTTLTTSGRALIDDASTAAQRTTLGLAIGSDVHAYTANGNTILTDAGVLSVAGLTTATDKMIYTTASDTYATTDLTAFVRTTLDDATAGEFRATIGAAASGGDIKGWANVQTDGTSSANSNVSATAKTTTGKYTVTWDTDFSSANYSVVGSITHSAVEAHFTINGQTAGGLTIWLYDAGGSLADAQFNVMAAGAQ